MASFDVIFVQPYPFADHPSFPEAILSKALEAAGFTVGVIETPFWQKKESFAHLGRPRLFFAIIPGPVDSIVLNYTSTRKRRREDLYQIDGQAFFLGHPPGIQFKIRPDRVVVVYANRLREAFRDVPIVIGGVEASQRRFSHYDFQEDKIRRSILFDSRADLLVSGMGEKQIVEIARHLDSGQPASEVGCPGLVKVVFKLPEKDFVELPSHEEIIFEKEKLLVSALEIEKAAHQGKWVVQRHQNRWVVESPAMVYESRDLDFIYGQKYLRQHASHQDLSPALAMNLFSITSHRGCSGNCSFCSISSHEGRRVISRSEESILKEIESLLSHPGWKGSVSDIGGATANMYGLECRVSDCRKISGFDKQFCKTLETRKENRYRNLLSKARAIKGVKKVFIGSGVRHDLLLKEPELLEDILRFHSGRFLRVAPEHTEFQVLELMNKPAYEAFADFVGLFNSINRSLNRKIDLAPYLIVGHPGETEKDVLEMKKKLRSLDLKTTDIQIFTPTPGTLSTAMFYSESSARFSPIPVEKNIKNLIKRKNILLER